MLKNLYVVMGRSGSGKTMLVEKLREEFGYVQAESYTDRKKRHEGETGHHFLTPEEYDRMPGKILETVFDSHRYAMTKDMLDNSDIIVLDCKGILELLEQYHGKPVCIIGIEAEEDIIRKRMLDRGNTCSQVSQRIEHDNIAFSTMYSICDIIIKNNGTVEKLVDTAAGCIAKIESGNMA